LQAAKNDPGTASCEGFFMQLQAANVSTIGTTRVTDVSSTEWRWVIVFSTLLVALTLVPYAWAFASNTPNDRWQFMGVLPNPQDGATYFAKIGEGARGQWLLTLAHTPEASNGAAIMEFYLLLGHLATLIGMTAPLMFHVARITAGFVMYLSLYHLGASIWQRLRARRLFFGLIAVGSGLGWLAAIFVPALHPVDLYVPESIPFYSAYANPHFPLAIALVALIASAFVGIFRPGYKALPTFANGGFTLVVMSVVLALLQPQAWLPINMALALYLVIHVVRTRKLPPRYQIQWVALALLSGLPVLLYDQALVTFDPLYHIWNAQNVTPSGSPLNYLFGFGLLLLVAIPGIWRALRKFEQDGDRLMLVWLLSNIILLYAPLNIQRRFAIGLLIPIIYFAVRSLEDYWFNHISPRWRDAGLVALFVFIAPSNVFILVLTLVGVAQPRAGLQNYQLLPADYSHAITWLHDNTTPDSVVLAPLSTSLWMPAYTPARVVYGHPFETVNASVKAQEVADWYAGRGCTELISKYHVQYVVLGPSEMEASAGAAGVGPTSPVITTICVRAIGKPVATFGSVVVYSAAAEF